ncbi:TPA: conserved phage C-terminal domain-containing protein [Streptococcus pneumoniae]|nr:conserved phage C-terminal domain-containing protein [Streptococcus pneumoniae]HEW8502413.1 conserved phage C-terminal domain-containing protein [Streptococcus pneumoniae]HEX0677809.1 conserved phage C-terminal domain-containing protein [Streptococcus pneumoniae]
MIKKSEVTGFLSFFKFPKPFIYDEKYKSLSNHAKLLYMLLFGRLEISIKNGWHDRDGNVFQYYTNEQLMVDLNSSEKTIIKFKKELKDVGLLKEVRQGNNLPNRIYISAVDGTVNSTVSELEILQSGTVKTTVSELEILQTNKTDNNEIDNNNNKLLICKEIISYLNLKAKKNFKVDTASHQKFIKARLKEGYVLEDFKKVVDIMVAKWKGTEYEQYLQPQTLFGNKMDNYLNQPMPKRSTILTSTVDERLGF